MISEQRAALDKAVTTLREGRLSRRTFFERALVLGLSSSAAVAILDACGPASSTSAGPVSLQIMDAGGYLPFFGKDMIESYRRAYPNKVSSVEYLPRVQAPDLPGKLKVQQDAKRVSTSLIASGYDGVASCSQQGLVENLVPSHQSALPDLSVYLDGAKAYNSLAQGFALVFSYTPSGPLFEYDPVKLPNPPQTIDELKAWITANPHKFLYARPANSGPGRTLLMGLPYLLGDTNPQDPVSGWTNTWAWLKDIHPYVGPHPTRTGDTMTSLANDTSYIIASTFGWYVNPRALNQVPASAKWFTLKNTTFIADAAFMMMPKGLDAAHQSVVLDLMSWMLQPAQQAFTYDTGYFYPGPAIQNVPITNAPSASQSVNQTYGDPKFDAVIQSTPVKTPLSPTALVAAFNKWDTDINGH